MKYSKFLLAIAAGYLLAASGIALAQPASITVDFNDPDADVLDQIVTFGDAELREDGGFGNTGYLSITDAANGERGAIAFPELTEGGDTTAESFRITALLRVGAGTNRPADGFSFNFIRPDDPLIVDILDPDTGELDPDGTIGAYASSPAGEGNLPEEGSQTGIAIGFDEWQSGPADAEQNFAGTGIEGGGTFDGVASCGPSDTLAASIDAGRDVIEHDCIGLSIRIDNELVAQAPFPILNGELDNLQSLQTGPQGDAEDLGFAELSIGVVPDITDTAFSNITISYKGVDVFDERVEYEQGPGFLFFGGRTGGANAAHHIDNISIVTNFTQIELPGDFNEDGTIDFTDFLTLVNNMNLPDQAYEDGDFDFNGRVDISDFVGFRNAFADFNASGEAASVPEPAACLMALFGIMGLSGFRRRRR